MFGRDGRLWLAASVRGAENPAFCKAGSDHPSAKAFPMERAVRHLAVFDLKTRKYTFVETCYSTHHPQFGYDANDTIWTSGGGPVVGWLNTKMFDQTGDAAKSQGWRRVLDTSSKGSGMPTEPIAGDARRTLELIPVLSVMPGPGRVRHQGSVGTTRLVPGANSGDGAGGIYRGPRLARGADIDRGRLSGRSAAPYGRFDRRKCGRRSMGPKPQAPLP
jgi:hypothetical protein